MAVSTSTVSLTIMPSKGNLDFPNQFCINTMSKVQLCANEECSTSFHYAGICQIKMCPSLGLCELQHVLSRVCMADQSAVDQILTQILFVA